MSTFAWVKSKFARVTKVRREARLESPSTEWIWPLFVEVHNKAARVRSNDCLRGNPPVNIPYALNAPSQSFIHEEQKERGGCSSRANSNNRDGHRHDKEDEQHDIRRTIWSWIATSTIDHGWAVILDICARVSATEVNAKGATEALIREFRYGGVIQQLAAARLWEIMLLRSSEFLVRQCAKSEFMDNLEHVLASQHTSLVVRKRLLEVLSLAAAKNSGTPYESSFRVLLGKVKPAGMPDEGVLDPDHAMTNPLLLQRSTAIIITPDCPPVHPQSSQAPPDTDSVVKSAPGFECGICLEEEPIVLKAIIDSCGHTFCRESLLGHVTARLDERRFPILCPTCTADKGNGKGKTGEVSQSLVLSLGLTEKQLSIWTEMEMSAFSVLSHCRRCDRSMFVARDEYEEATLISCPLPGCKYVWCRQCQRSVESRGPKHSCDGTAELDHLMKEKGWKYCPTCHAAIEKTERCNHMTCRTPACNTHFCYLCSRLIVKSVVAEDISEATSKHFGGNDCKFFAVSR